MPAEKLLIVEDDKNILKLLQFNLEAEGYRVVKSSDGEQGLALLRQERPDLVLLDVMLPKLNGFDFCKVARKETQVPILFLTAKKEEVDKVLALELGADDYVTKPFGVREVVSRVKAILRRSRGAAAAERVLRAGGMELDLERHELKLKGKACPASSKEFELLKLMLEAGGRVLTREIILEKVWGYDRSLDLDTRTVDQHVKRLRAKLGADGERLLTVKNVGYRFRTD